MERLYYEPPKITGRAVAVGTSNGFNEYLTKVALLIPSEIIAGYLFLLGLAGTIKNPSIQIVGYWVAFAAGLILTPVYLNKAAKPGLPKNRHIGLSTIGFIFWAYATTGATLSGTIAPNIYDPAISSFLLVLFSLISGKVPLNK